MDPLVVSDLFANSNDDIPSLFPGLFKLLHSKLAIIRYEPVRKTNRIIPLFRTQNVSEILELTRWILKNAIASQLRHECMKIIASQNTKKSTPKLLIT